jgi:F-type H+-transporting ATPase subunit gamma
MANVRQIRRRIRSVQNTIRVTRAMEMIAASKMRRAQQAVEASRPYSQRIQELLYHLAAQVGSEDVSHPLMQSRFASQIALVHITPDRGLSGGLNSNLNRFSGKFLLDQNLPAKLIAVGKKGRDFMLRSGRDVRAIFTDIGDRPGIEHVLPITKLITEDYANGSVDQVYMVYSQFINVMVQRPTLVKLLPVEPSPELETTQLSGYVYEPDIPGVLDALLPRFVEMQIYQAFLESAASEQAARMVAMRTATDAANEFLGDLTLAMNKARQETITAELLDIVGGVAALE